jgi:hypothetical protein
LGSELETSNRVAFRHTSVSAQLDSVGTVVVSHDSECTSGTSIGPAAAVCHVSSVGVVVHRRGCRVEARVWEGIITILKSRVAEVVRAVAIPIEVVCEQAGKTSGGGHHSTSIVAHVHEVHSVAVGSHWIRARYGESLDEVEEALVTVSTSCEGRTARRVIALVLCTTSVGNLLALVVVDDSLTS